MAAVAVCSCKDKFTDTIIEEEICENNSENYSIIANILQDDIVKTFTSAYIAHASQYILEVAESENIDTTLFVSKLFEFDFASIKSHVEELYADVSDNEMIELVSNLVSRIDVRSMEHLNNSVYKLSYDKQTAAFPLIDVVSDFRYDFEKNVFIAKKLSPTACSVLATIGGSYAAWVWKTALGGVPGILFGLAIEVAVTVASQEMCAH